MRTDVQSAVSVVKPVLQALVLAEQVYEDKSGKKIICGTFNRVVLSKQPHSRPITTPAGQQLTAVRGGGRIGCPYVYMSLNDVCDNTMCELQVVSLTKNVVIFRLGLLITNANRLETVEYFTPLPPPEMFLSEAGIYAIDVVCEGEVIGSHRLTVIDGDAQGGT